MMAFHHFFLGLSITVLLSLGLLFVRETPNSEDNFNVLNLAKKLVLTFRE